MGLPDLSLALSTKSTSEDISAACTAASGFKIVVKLSNASASSHQAYKCKTNAPRRWSVDFWPRRPMRKTVILAA